ncbi:hypothetical protein D3C71_1632730 [compost metagenome]
MVTVEQHLNKKEENWLKFMKYGSKLGCHQKSERSFFIGKYQFPVCARCTGVIIGYIISPLLLLTGIYRPYLSLLFCVIMFMDWYIQYLKIKSSNNIRRLVTGMLGGIGILNIIIYIIQFIISAIV